jgi:hypothetical protein
MFDVGRMFPTIGARGGLGAGSAQMAGLISYGAAGFARVRHNFLLGVLVYNQKIRFINLLSMGVQNLTGSVRKSRIG